MQWQTKMATWQANTSRLEKPVLQWTQFGVLALRARTLHLLRGREGCRRRARRLLARNRVSCRAIRGRSAQRLEKVSIQRRERVVYWGVPFFFFFFFFFWLGGGSKGEPKGHRSLFRGSRHSQTRRFFFVFCLLSRGTPGLCEGTFFA